MKKILSIPEIKNEKCAEKLSEVFYSLPEVEEITVDIENKVLEIELSYNLSNDVLKSIAKSAGKYEVVEIK